MELLNFIGGEFVPAESKKTFTKLSPFDGSLLAEVSSSDAIDVIKALQGAKKAATSFKSLSQEERARFLDQLADYIQNHASEIALAEAQYQGLLKSFVLENSVYASLKALRSTAQDLRVSAEESFHFSPSGIVGIITPWTLSLKLVIERLAPALAAGNGVLIKVSEQSPITVKILGDALQAVGVPAGIVQILQGSAEVGQVIAGHPGIRAITAVGKQSTLESIARVGTQQLKKLQLSGAAKNSILLLADSDFENGIENFLKSFLLGQGQMCWNSSRLFVPENQAKGFLEKIENYINNLEPETSPEGQGFWTPLISEDAVQEVLSKSRTAQEEHGKIICGGKRPENYKGFFCRPTVILDLPQCSLLQQEEVVGPLLLVTPVKYQHEAVKWANTSYLGHSAVVWGSEEKSLKVAASLEVAQVWTNSWLNRNTGTIYGNKQSSFGNLEIAWSGSFYSDVRNLAGV